MLLGVQTKERGWSLTAVLRQVVPSLNTSACFQWEHRGFRCSFNHQLWLSPWRVWDTLELLLASKESCPVGRKHDAQLREVWMLASGFFFCGSWPAGGEEREKRAHWPVSCSKVWSAGLHHMSHCGGRKHPSEHSFFCCILREFGAGWLCWAVRSILPSQPPSKVSSFGSRHGFPLSLWLVYQHLLIYFANCCCCTRSPCHTAPAWQVTSFLLSPYLKDLCVLNWNCSDEAEILEEKKKKKNKQLFECCKVTP